MDIYIISENRRNYMTQLSKLFGKKITFASKLVRGRDRQFDGVGKYGKGWNPKSIKPTEGIIIGKRRLQKGFREYIDEYVGWQFITMGYIPAILVAVDMNRNPIYIPIDEVDFNE